MNYRGWMLIGFSKEYRTGKIEERTFMNSDVLVFRGESGKLNVIEPHCSHFGVNMATGRVVKDCIQCPMHGRVFKGDGRGANPKHKPIRSYPVHESHGLVFAWFDQEGVAPQWDPPPFLNDENPDILWSHSRTLYLHHPSVPLDNSVDPRHFEFTHSMFGKQTADGDFVPNGHRARGEMAAELREPLATLSGGRAEIITHFDGCLNTYLEAKVSRNAANLCNFLTIIEGKKCVLHQMGIGKKSRSPAALASYFVGYWGSWFATYEDAPVWNHRKVQEPDNYAHKTDQALMVFREWFETFAYDPTSGDEKLVQLRSA